MSGQGESKDYQSLLAERRREEWRMELVTKTAVPAASALGKKEIERSQRRQAVSARRGEEREKRVGKEERGATKRKQEERTSSQSSTVRVTPRGSESGALDGLRRVSLASVPNSLFEKLGRSVD